MDKLKNNIGVIMVILGLIGSTGTFYSKFAKMELTVSQLKDASMNVDVDFMSVVAVLEEKVKKLESADTSHDHDFDHTHDSTETKILKKEIELLQVQIEEIRAKTSDPLAN